VPHHINANVDKSTLQSVSVREGKWLSHHFRDNLPPVLFAEALGDLEKTKGLATDNTSVDEVRMLTKQSIALGRFSTNLIIG
jgi:hypothetical protein